MSGAIKLDYQNMLAERLGGRGFAAERMKTLETEFATVHKSVRSDVDAGKIGFFRLPYERDVVARIRNFAEGIGQAFDTVVVLGIGGSALGTLALQHALKPPHWNELDDERREYFPKLYVLDNVDPTTIGPFFERLDLRRTLVNVVSKSGATAETMAQFLIIRERLQQLFDDDGYRGHLIFTTDPEKGVLRELANAENIPVLAVPPDVGGRFSVLSAVGLLPAALIGIDIEALLQGAADMDARCKSDNLTDNPAALFAMLQYNAHVELDAPIHVMMAYTDRLYLIADWFRQLWAESLGKKHGNDGSEVFKGPTPVKALGATDQHSQVQLYMEGPFDKTITFLATSDFGIDVAIPKLYQNVPALAYLGGHTLGELLNAERLATRQALAASGRMNMTIELPSINAHTMGQLLMMLQIATVYAGALYDVDPFDQPGVELGKELTYGLMGRAGYEKPEV
ncbi:MAG TPA: glucose-6-phosphate isomerase [Longimicrobiales bacterium]|nr:glucose-6-phosphate isomerase [Longimicrobiales bacterium]